MGGHGEFLGGLQEGPKGLSLGEDTAECWGAVEGAWGPMWGLSPGVSRCEELWGRWSSGVGSYVVVLG